MVRIVITITTTAKYRKTRLKTIRETWSNHVEHLFFSDEEDLSQGILKVTDRSDYTSNVTKANATIKWAHENDVDFILLCDDDGFVLSQNLNTFASAADPNCVHCFIISPDTDPPNQAFIRYGYDLRYPSGGAGILIPKKVADQIWDKIEIIDATYCDLNIGFCLNKLKIPMIHDARFNMLNPHRYTDMEQRIRNSFHFHLMSDEESKWLYKIVYSV